MKIPAVPAIVACLAMVFAVSIWNGAEGESEAPSLARAPVGISARIEQLVIPGPELEALPIEDRQTPVVVRILETYRHGSDYRYDLEVYGLEPGRHDLRKYLRRKDQSSLDSVPPLWIDVESRLPPGQLLPSDVQASPIERIGGYRLAMGGLCIVWLAGMAWLLFGGRRRQTVSSTEESRELSPAELLRPLILDAVAGRITPQQQAELERVLLRYWRRRLHLEDADPVSALAIIRDHPQAGSLLRQIEDWLHRPGGAQHVDIATVLKPYENPPDVVDQPALAAVGGA